MFEQCHRHGEPATAGFPGTDVSDQDLASPGRPGGEPGSGCGARTKLGEVRAGSDGALAAIEAGLDWLARADVASLPVAEQAECLRRLERVASAQTAARARLLSAFTAQSGFEADGQRSAKSWLVWQTRVTGAAAAGSMGWMRRLAKHPGVADALAARKVSASWAGEICGWSDRLPPEARGDADTILLAAAGGGAGLADLSGLAEEMFRRTAPPDSDGDDDGFTDRGLRLDLHFRGAGRLTGDLTPECAAALTAVLESLGKRAGPEDDRTQVQRDHDALAEACQRIVAVGGLPDVAGQPVQVQLHMTLDQLRRLDGAAELERSWLAGRAAGPEQSWLAGQAAGDGTPGWAASRAAAEAYACDAVITPIVTGHLNRAVMTKIAAEFIAGFPGGVAFRGQPAAAVTADGKPIRDRRAPRSPDPADLPPGTLARLNDTVTRHAADVLSGPAGLAAFLRTGLLKADFPAVSLPLDVGTATRTVPPYLRRAVIKRDRHCAFPGCAQRPARCHAHHVVPRAKGGATSLTNLILLCPFHHLVAVHRWGWTITLHGDGTTTAVSPDRKRTLHSHGPPATTAA